MLMFKPLLRLWCRFRHPVSLPEDVARDLGTYASNRLSFEALVRFLNSPGCRPTHLVRWMERDEAESYFLSAKKKERFGSKTFFSYCFEQGWLIVVLQFNEEHLLSRLYVEAPSSLHVEGFDLPLVEPVKRSLQTA